MIAAHLWQSTWFALAAAALALALRRQRAQVRYALWLAASLKFLVPFELLVELGRRLSWVSSAPFAALPPVPAAVARISQPWISPTVWTQALPLGPAPHASDAWLVAALVLWAAGAAAIALWRLRAWRRLRALVSASQPLALAGLTLPPGVEARSVPGVSRQLGDALSVSGRSLPGSDARPQPDHREGGSNQRWPCHLEPGVVGWLRPKLLLPADIAKHLAPDQLRAVLGHE
ncbi:MAG: hypothetical protein ACRD1L_01965, partial [Terriglobales bacterium]